MAHGFHGVRVLQEDTGISHPDSSNHVSEGDQQEKCDGHDIEDDDGLFEVSGKRMSPECVDYDENHQIDERDGHQDLGDSVGLGLEGSALFLELAGLLQHLGGVGIVADVGDLHPALAGDAVGTGENLVALVLADGLGLPGEE